MEVLNIKVDDISLIINEIDGDYEGAIVFDDEEVYSTYISESLDNCKKILLIDLGELLSKNLSKR